MTQPIAYTRQFNFKNQQSLTPSAPNPGDKLDAEFNAVKISGDAVRAALALIQRDDGALANASVGLDQLSPTLSVGFLPRGVWEPGVAYLTGDGVSYGAVFYRARVPHTSVTGAPPSTNTAQWTVLFDLSFLAGVIEHASDQAPDGTLAQPGLGFQAEASGFIRSAVGAIGVVLQGAQRFLIDGTGFTLPQDPIGALQATTKQYVDAAIASAINLTTPVASGKDFYGATLPLGNWLWANGAAVSRTTYAALFAAIGTTYGAGDGTTTFNLPDRRERAAVGSGTMGGTVSPGRITAATMAGGSTLGNAAGEERHQLVLSELASHPHGTTEAPHTHAATQAPHTHTVTSPNTPASITSGTGGTAVPGTFLNTTSSATPSITVPAVSTNLTVNSAGGDAPHNNLQPTLVCNFIVKY